MTNNRTALSHTTNNSEYIFTSKLKINFFNQTIKQKFKNFGPGNIFKKIIVQMYKNYSLFAQGVMNPAASSWPPVQETVCATE